MSESEDFYTLTGYRLRGQGLTPAMEDYLEMICRLSESGGEVRLGKLSRRLHVKPSSASKMIRQLEEGGFLRAPRYGCISLTPQGKEAGSYLLYRHGVVQRFLCALNGTACELEQAEKIEHFLNPATVANLDALRKRLEEDNI